MRIGFCHAAVLTGTMLFTVHAGAQPAPPEAECTGQPGVAWEQQIKSCTALIEKSQGIDRALAHKNRGNAYLAQQDHDRALADYNEAVRLDPNFAAAYNNRGRVYLDRGDLDRAMAEFNEANRVDPKYALSYGGRIEVYVEKGDLDGAIAEASKALAMDPNSADFYGNRGGTYERKGDFPRAIADLNEAIRLEPKNGARYFGRAVASLYAGDLPKALEDFKQASALAPDYAYTPLWLDIVETRSKLPSTLREASAKVDMKAWPAPIIRMFEGEMTSAAVLAAAEDPDATTKRWRLCEANFFSGVLARRQSADEDAIRLFRLAANECPKAFYEWTSAHAELRALGAPL
jgi:tetratricopeptide (TPR) repeat protein